MQELVNYFQKLTAESYQLIEKIGLSSEIRPLAELIPDLSRVLDDYKAKTLETYSKLAFPQLEEKEYQILSNDIKGVGLNSIGMLLDRLSILIIKEWCLRNKTNANKEKADKLYQAQTQDIIYALASAEPGSSAMNTKITRHKSEVSADSLEEAFYGLLATNILLWESQEILYVKNIDALSCEELRDYIKWFSFGNIQRNAYIEYCETLYWSKRSLRKH